jgi:DNA-binding NarL/FixJ family response regulator
VGRPDQTIVRVALRVALGAHVNVAVAGVAYDGQQALLQVEALRPDLVLMDLKMPMMIGVQATREIHARHPEIPVLVLTTYDEDEWVIDAIRAGAAGYLLKDAGAEELVAAIAGTVAGRTHVDPSVAAARHRTPSWRAC